MSNSLPSTIGKYQIIREIARSNDIVYEAWDPLMNRRVAIKELNMPTGVTSQQKEDRINRFRREARAAGALAHPNIMTIFEVGEEQDGRHFIAMEYLDGHTLRNEIDDKGFLPPDRAVEIINFVLAGLSFAHEKGVIHRDVKPDNVQILSDDRVKLTDFGIARLTFEPNLTQDGQVFGTPSYMSPEQIVGRDLDARSDLFSVGVMLYEMISGKKPFQGDSVVAITYSIMNKEAERPQQVNFALWQVLSRAMEKSPVMRFSSAHEMQQAINEAQKAVQSDGLINMTSPYGAAMPAQAQPATGLPPIVNPYASAGFAPPVIAQPAYNPPIAPVFAPPGQPVYDPTLPAGVAPSPALSGYLPPNVTYQSPGTQMGYAPTTPIYYPPPPRQPLLKPLDQETKYFIGRLLLSILIFGAIFALVVGVLSCAGKVATNIQETPRPKGPVGDQIRALENQRKANPDDQNTLKQLADAYSQLASDQEKSGNYVDAVDSYDRAIQLDPTRYVDMTQSAHLLEAMASTATDLKEKADKLTLAGQAWEAASKVDRDSDRPVQDREFAAQDYFQAAEVDPSTDRLQHLDEAIHLSPNPGLTAEIREFEQSQNQPGAGAPTPAPSPH
jgi:serine/threonine-protein kinase